MNTSILFLACNLNLRASQKKKMRPRATAPVAPTPRASEDSSYLHQLYAGLLEQYRL